MAMLSSSSWPSSGAAWMNFTVSLRMNPMYCPIRASAASGSVFAAYTCPTMLCSVPTIPYPSIPLQQKNTDPPLDIRGGALKFFSGAQQSIMTV